MATKEIITDYTLRIDTPQKLFALSLFHELDPFNIQHCEELIPRWDYMNLAGIRTLNPIIIMADESCCNEHDAKKLIDLKACDFFNVKIGKSAEIFKALTIIQLAEKEGIKIQLGGFLESRLAFTAAAHLALVSESIKFFDFDTQLMFIEDSVIGGISYNNKGVIEVPDTPGLGATIDPHYLKGLISATV